MPGAWPCALSVRWRHPGERSEGVVLGGGEGRGVV